MTPTPRKTFRNLSVEKQETIIRIAVDEFAKHGYSNASINVMVQRIGIAKGSIYQYFGDKKGLFLFVFSHSMEQVKSYLREIRDTTTEEPLASRLEKTLFAGVYFIRDNPEIYKLYGNIIADSAMPFREDILITLKQYSIDFISSLLETAKAKGEIRQDIDIKKAGFIIDAVMDKFLLSRTIPYADAGMGIFIADTPTAAEWITDIVNMVCSGISGSSFNSNNRGN